MCGVCDMRCVRCVRRVCGVCACVVCVMCAMCEVCVVCVMCMRFNSTIRSHTRYTVLCRKQIDNRCVLSLCALFSSGRLQLQPGVITIPV